MVSLFKLNAIFFFLEKAKAAIRFSPRLSGSHIRGRSAVERFLSNYVFVLSIPPFIHEHKKKKDKQQNFLLFLVSNNQLATHPPKIHEEPASILLCHPECPQLTL